MHNPHDAANVTRIVEKAQDAFWAVVAAALPDITSGDFGPEETLRFDNACRVAVDTWITNNQRDLGWSFLLDAFQDELAVNASLFNTGGGLMAIRIELADDWYALLTDPEGDIDVFDPHIAYDAWTLGLYPPMADGAGDVYVSLTSVPLDRLVAQLGPLLRRLKS